ncbi:pitrilysin family protein [Erythrobacter sp. HL-111]|uniref:M16 family metallopeptidase n=1 Tax=Erythrobacter sp. HL-111 TaxID=1798193 RepID=UPI0006DA8D67|nr:insulinase family protein [Erythrobacter sp. HL-111]KPP93414.1 MAG: zinc protease [Erythrobacteraceae bacterium HL-111]SDR70140.1 zinc protease [Erythrobacter sp. HL-111]
MIATLRLFVAGLCLALLPIVFAPLQAQDPASDTPPPPPQWPFEASDVPLEPGYVLGTLPNGMRYILRENATPEGTALVRMRIGSGSLEEREEERGLSHYLEHMAFNGSRRVPEGEMIKLLEREGLAFGADTNASTGYEAITYMLNLPRNDPDLLDTALMLMRETASELTIDPDAVERERGVILAERRDRAGYALDAYRDEVDFLAPGARYGARLPIGTLDVLERADAAAIRALYERTYVPANTVLVVVGDYPVNVMEEKIRALFADWDGGPAPEEPVSGPIDVTRKGETRIHLDPALSESITLTRLAPYRDEPDTLAARERSTLRSIGYAIVNRRLAALARGADAPFSSARFGSGDLFEDARITRLSVNTPDGEWRGGMLAAVQTVNEALEYGFTQAELDEQVAGRRTGLGNLVAAAASRTHAAFANAALRLVDEEVIPTDPAFALGFFEELAERITPEAVHAALREDAIPLKEPLIRFEGRSAPEGGEAALRAAFTEAMALPVAPPNEAAAAEFAYGDFGEPGTVAEDQVDERLGIRLVTFENGVRLNLKRTDIREDRLQVFVAVDGGQLLETKDDPLATAMISALAGGGLGAHSEDELATILAGRTVSFGMSSGADRFAMSAATTPRDLALQLRLSAALLTDPGYRPEGEERYARSIEDYFANLDATPARALGAALGGLLSDGDPRFTLQSEEAYLARDFAALREVVEDRFAKGAIEVAVVGDIDEDAAIAAVATTFGALPPREAEFRERPEARRRSFTADRSPRVLTHAGEPDQALLRLTWPTTDDSDHGESLRLAVLARAVQVELTERLREKLGQAYSPGANSSPSRTYEGYGTFQVQAALDVAAVDAARDAIRGLVEDFRAGAVDADTLERAKRPLLEDYQNALKNLGGWMGLVARAQSEPERIDRWLAVPGRLDAIGLEDIAATARRWLDPEEALEVLVLPKAACTAEADC